MKSWHLNLERISNIEAVLRATELDMRGVEIIPQIFREDARDVALKRDARNLLRRVRP